MTSPRSVVFAKPARTAIRTFGGSLKEIAAPNLGAAAVKAAIERAGLKPDEVGTVAMGTLAPAWMTLPDLSAGRPDDVVGGADRAAIAL